MYKNRFFVKAKSTIFKSVFGLFLLFTTSINFAQTWDYSISKDYEFSIQDMWAESAIYTAKFVLSNQKTAFVKEIELTDDQIGKLVFPDDFIKTRGKFNKDTVTNFNWYIEVRRKKVAQGNINYNPSPNTTLQLSKYELIEFESNDMVWGNILDSYKWDDKNGTNIFVRSEVTNIKANTNHLYMYHFLEEENEYKLVRKFSDFVKDCDKDIAAEHIIESIELTDINKDTIAEISFSYSVDCVCKEDSLPINTKLFLITNGQKYAIRGKLSSIDSKSEYLIGGNLKKKDLYRRFLVKKWKKLAGEEESIYN